MPFDAIPHPVMVKKMCLTILFYSELRKIWIMFPFFLILGTINDDHTLFRWDWHLFRCIPAVNFSAKTIPQRNKKAVSSFLRDVSLHNKPPPFQLMQIYPKKIKKSFSSARCASGCLSKQCPSSLHHDPHGNPSTEIKSISSSILPTHTFLLAGQVTSVRRREAFLGNCLSELHTASPLAPINWSVLLFGGVSGNEEAG